MEKEEMKPVGEAGIIMELPESKVPADIFWELIYAAVGKSQVLKHGIDFKVFNHLAESISAEEVARRLGTKPEPTSRLLDMLVVIGVITKKDGRYVNTSLAEEYLAEGKLTYMGDMYAMSVEMYDKSMNPSGICISQHSVVNEDRTWPQGAAWWSHINAIAGRDMTLYETAISDAMLNAGFKSVESRYVKDLWSVDRVDIARK